MSVMLQLDVNLVNYVNIGNVIAYFSHEASL